MQSRIGPIPYSAEFEQGARDPSPGVNVREKLSCTICKKKIIFASCFVRFFQEVVLLPAVQFLAAKDNFLCLSSEKNHFLWLCSAEAGLYSSLQFSSRLVCWERRRRSGRKKFSWAMFLFEFLCCHCRHAEIANLLALFFCISCFFCVNPRPGGAIFAKFALLSARYVGQYEPASFSRYFNHTICASFGSAGSKKWLWTSCHWYWSSRWFLTFCLQRYPDKFSNQLREFFTMFLFPFQVNHFAWEKKSSCFFLS